MNDYHKWGFLRETRAAAKKAGTDADTGVKRTGLEDYLAVIFPEVNADEWIHDKPFGNHNGKNYLIRPDYRCDRLNLIIEFDGVQHYQNPDVIRKDINNENIYKSAGYEVVRIPYFIQLTNEVVKIMFDRDINEVLFDSSIPSMGVKGRNTPAYCCPAGIKRMKKDFEKYPQQREVNMKALQEIDDDYLSGINLI
ncbi:MAG: DUF559 domain-containing protein [Paludibacteraceae bacterium]